MTHLIAAIAMTLSVLEGHFPIVSRFKCDLLLQSLCICRVSCSYTCAPVNKILTNNRVSCEYFRAQSYLSNSWIADTSNIFTYIFV